MNTTDTAEIRVPGFHGDPLLVDHLEGNRRARDRYRKAVERGDDMTDRPEPDSAALDPLDPYRAVGLSLANMTSLLGEPPPPGTVRKILLELGFTHPVEATDAT